MNANPPLLSPELLGRLERLELVTRKIFRGQMKGERRSRRKGQSVEFADHRKYIPGDDPRFIDWNLYARLDKLFLRLFLEEEDLHFNCLIDTSQSMGFGDPSKLLFAKKLSAALGYIGLCRSDRIKIEPLTANRGYQSRPIRGKSNLWKLLKQVNNLPENENVSLYEGVKNFCIRNPGKGIVVLISDMMDKEGYESAITRLLAANYDIYVIQIFSQEELDPQLTGDLKLVDVEDQSVSEISVSPRMLELYQRSMQSFVGGIRKFCSARGITHLTCSTNQSVEKLVGGYLRTRGLVR